MVTGKSKKSSSEAAVLVSYRLQFYTVVTAVSIIVFQLLFLLGTSMFARRNGADYGYLTPAFAATAILPTIVFLIAFFTSKRYPVAISRWFIAVIKSFIILTFFVFLQILWQFIISVYMFQPGGYHQGPPPSFVTSNMPQYVAIGLAIIAMLVAIKVLKKR